MAVSERGCQAQCPPQRSSTSPGVRQKSQNPISFCEHSVARTSLAFLFSSKAGAQGILAKEGTNEDTKCHVDK